MCSTAPLSKALSAVACPRSLLISSRAALYFFAETVPSPVCMAVREPCLSNVRHRNSTDGAMPCALATLETVLPGR